MSRPGISEELREALTRLGREQDPDPSLLERVARWRRACGDAETAAQWQTWSLLPPTLEELRPALARVWSGLGETSMASRLLRADPELRLSWERLAVVLKRGEHKRAVTLQRKLLREPPDLDVNDLLSLVNQWQQAEQPQQALALLQPFLALMGERNTTPSAKLCCVMADLLEKEQRFDEAEPWWSQAHQSQPQWVWPLMSLGYQAMRRQQPTLAFHYASQCLKRDPEHAFAPDLQRNALKALGAERSLALLDGDEPPQPLPEPSCSPLPAEWVKPCRELALVSVDDPCLLQAWLQQLDDATPRPGRLHLINSHEPLWLQQQAQNLLPGTRVELWPTWDAQRHAAVELVLTVDANARAHVIKARVWHYDTETSRWTRGDD